MNKKELTDLIIKTLSEGLQKEEEVDASVDAEETVDESSSLSLANKKGKNAKPQALGKDKTKPKGKVNEEEVVRQKVREILLKEFFNK
jgi:hypothetical protein